MKFLLQVVRRPNQVSVAVTVLSVAKCQISWSFLICAFSSLINIFTSFNHFPSHYIFLNFFFLLMKRSPVETKKSLGVLKIGESLLKMFNGGKLINCKKKKKCQNIQNAMHLFLITPFKRLCIITDFVIFLWERVSFKMSV